MMLLMRMDGWMGVLAPVIGRCWLTGLVWLLRHSHRQGLKSKQGEERGRGRGQARVLMKMMVTMMA